MSPGGVCAFKPRSAHARVLRRVLRSAACAVLVLIPAGCSSTVKPIFEEYKPAIVWPAPPAPPRVRYVGQLRSSDDLKPRTDFFQAIGRLFVGRDKPEVLYGPRSVLRSHDGNRIWIADPGGRCLHKFDLQDREYDRITELDNSHLLSPVGLTVGPPGSMYLCDSEDIAIHLLSDSTGGLIDSMRLPEDIGRPVAAAYNESRDELYVVDVTAHDIKVLSRSGNLLRIIGRRGNAPGEFNFPCDIVDGGEMIWVADTGNHRIQGLTHMGEPVVSFGQAGDAPGDLAMPKGVRVDSEGHVYVIDARFENVQIFDAKGRLLLAFGGEGIGPGEFWLPSGLFIDVDDRIWVCDSYNRRVQVFDYVRIADTPDAGEEHTLDAIGEESRQLQGDAGESASSPAVNPTEEAP